MPSLRREKGMVLLLVLVVVALLSALVTEFAFSTLVNMRLTETFRDSTKAYYLAKGGIQAGRMMLQEDKRLDGLKTNPFDAKSEFWGQGLITNYPVGGGAVTVDIEDLDGRLDLNGLVNMDNPQTVSVDRVFRLFDGLGLPDAAELTADLIDWIDSGDTPYTMIRTDGRNIRTDGAEDGYYMHLAQPYHCKNAPLDSLDELAMVRGFTPEVIRTIRPYICVRGSEKININSALAEVILSLVQPGDIDGNTADAILEYRKANPISRIEDIQNLPGVDVNAYSALKSLNNAGQLGVTSTFYQIEARATVNDGSRSVLAVVNRDRDELLYQKVY
jgi:general secretion pathway protein K